jgi:hypothetical protein
LRGQDSWQIPIQIECKGWNTELVFGINAEGLDYFDKELDFIAPPSEFVPYAYFKITDPIFNFFTKDIRKWQSPYDSEINWILKIINTDEIKTTIS